MLKKKNLPPSIEDIIGTLLTYVKKFNLDPFTTVFEMVDHKQMNEIAAYGGFPIRYPHWRWGMEYDKLKKSYSYGLSTIYEMVINNDPCYAYLLDSNSLTTQKTVIAHVYGHSDFFKNNLWFTHTNRKMLDQTANNAITIKKIMSKIEHGKVEKFIDICLSIENLIDSQRPFYSEPFTKQKPTKENQDSLEMSETNLDESDVLFFLLKKAPLENWQYKILSIIRDESYYFAPQKQTKILNEGWATYWHSKMMTEIVPLDSSEIIDYCDQYSKIVHNQIGQLNPYRLGLELLRHIEYRWNKGKHGLEFLKREDSCEQKNITKNNGHEKLFAVRKTHNDLTFIDEFMDEDFCQKHDLYLYSTDVKSEKKEITSRNHKEIKEKILTNLTNSGNPIIKIIDENYKNRGELLLEHKHDKKDLDKRFCQETLKNLTFLWTKPVHIKTIFKQQEKIISHDIS